MNRYVVSAQRSGLNWFRFCFESFYGRRTPGKTSLLHKTTHGEQAFLRSHDALNLTARARKRPEGSWRPFDPKAMAGNKVLLILRDPLELYVRMADCKRGKFLSFVSNIKFYDQAVGAERMVVHYEDLVADPATMCATMAFFELSPADGLPVPTEALVRDRWEALGTASRQNYDQKQGGSGGAQTKDNPTDFAHHQRSLSEAEKREVWAFLSLRLTASEMALLKRYQPAKLPRPTLGDRLRNLVV